MRGGGEAQCMREPGQGKSLLTIAREVGLRDVEIEKRYKSANNADSRYFSHRVASTKRYLAPNLSVFLALSGFPHLETRLVKVLPAKASFVRQCATKRGVLVTN